METEAFVCKCCGGKLNVESALCVCEYCGATNFISVTAGKYISQLNYANKLRQEKEYDHAINIYDNILSENNPTADILWLRTLCEYGIEYVPDPISSRYFPTLHRIKDESILNYHYYLEALDNCDEEQRECIENEAKIIADIQNEYLGIVSKEKPYDVFICYKETDDASNLQTEDSKIGLDLYEKLTGYGYKVFFSKVTLQDKIGVNYEPYIFGALKSAKILILLGTKKEYFTSVWVKNEWSRFLKLMESDRNKQMFFACNSVEDLPPAFQRKQAQMLNWSDAVQNLADSVKKYLDQTGKVSNKKTKKTHSDTDIAAVKKTPEKSNENQFHLETVDVEGIEERYKKIRLLHILGIALITSLMVLFWVMISIPIREWMQNFHVHFEALTEWFQFFGMKEELASFILFVYEIIADSLGPHTLIEIVVMLAAIVAIINFMIKTALKIVSDDSATHENSVYVGKMNYILRGFIFGAFGGHFWGVNKSKAWLFFVLGLTGIWIRPLYIYTAGISFADTFMVCFKYKDLYGKIEIEEYPYWI